MLKKIIDTVFDTKIEEFSKILSPREFISKQLKMLDTKLKLKSFIKRKETFSFVISFPSENITLKAGKFSGKEYTLTVSENFENFKTDERINN